MAGWLFIAFVTVPFAELWLLLQLGSAVGAGATFGLVFLTGAVGAWLARREGYRTLLGIQKEMARGALPAAEMVDGLIIFMGGALLLTPGMLTDALGFSMIFPLTRSLMRGALVTWMQEKIQSGAAQVHVYQPPGAGPGSPGQGFGQPPRPRADDPRIIDATFDEDGS